VPSSPLLLLAAAAVGTAVALVDAARSGDTDSVVLLSIVLLLLLALGTSLLRVRSAVLLRPDLGVWLQRQADATGEPAGRLADRCVAAYRAGLTGDTGEPAAREQSRA
jgi:hypothetical protein